MARSPSIPPADITSLLKRWSSGEDEALHDLIPVVYEELRRVAHRRLASGRSNSSLSPTDLLHEAFVRLIGSDQSWNDRVHFFAVAAGAMRQVLVDRARRRLAKKRGGEARQVTLHEVPQLDLRDHEALLSLNGALERLEQKDARKARAVELHLFAGLTYEETAQALEVSVVTIERDLRFARAWLQQELTR